MTRALTGSSEDREEQKRINRSRLQKRDDIVALMEIPAGRRFLMRLLDELQPESRKMFAQGIDLHRNVVLYDFGSTVRRWLKDALPLGYLRLLEEKTQREEVESSHEKGSREEEGHEEEAE